MSCARAKLPDRLVSRVRQLSIRSRLTLRYVAVLGFALLVYGGLVNVLLMWSVWSVIDRDLASETQALRLTLSLSPGLPLAEQQVALPDIGLTASPDALAQLIGPDGQVLASSANAGALPLPNDKRALDQALAGHTTYATLERRGLWLRVYLLPLVEEGRVVGVLWMARSLETLAVALDRLQAILVGVGLLTLLLAGAWGWRLACGALRPVDEMTRATRGIGHAQDFDRRVAYSGPRDELGQLAATFNKMLARLQEAHRHTEHALATQRRFVADASHELRTPLTSLRGNVGILRREFARVPAAPVEAVTILVDVEDALARLSRLVDGLLTLARADAGQHIARAPVDLDEVVSSAFRQAQALPSRATPRLECQEGVEVSGSADHLTQLLLILLENAIAYTPPGGQVILSLGREGDDAVLGVSDTGIGIDPGDLPHIFDRFYRGRAVRRARGDGSGLGLAIARWIVDEHGGRIAVSSEVGRGSRFTVRLPATPGPGSGQGTPRETRAIPSS